MCLLWGTNWIFISQNTPFFIATAVKTSNLTCVFISQKTIYLTHLFWCSYGLAGGHSNLVPPE
jgi:hypothetical protein